MTFTSDRPATERFFEKVNKFGYRSLRVRGRCWTWTAGTYSPGKKNNRLPYGKFWFEGRSMPAHIFSYELLHGKVPDGLQLDHLCRKPRCVNPKHLEAVTPYVNTSRSDHTMASRNRAKTRCPSGHEYSASNTLICQGKRFCRTCARESMRRRRAANR